MHQTLYGGLHVIQSMAIQRGGPQPHLIDRETEAGVHSVRGSGHAAWNWPSWISDPPVFHSEAWTGLPSKPFLPVLDHGLTPWTVPSCAGVTVHLPSRASSGPPILSLDLKPRSRRSDPGVRGLGLLGGAGFLVELGVGVEREWGERQSRFFPSQVLRPLAVATTGYRGN